MACPSIGIVPLIVAALALATPASADLERGEADPCGKIAKKAKKVERKVRKKVRKTRRKVAKKSPKVKRKLRKAAKKVKKAGRKVGKKLKKAARRIEDAFR